MTNIPNWDHQTTEEKLQTLHDWCNNLSSAVQSLGGNLQSAHERLKKVEGQVAGKS